MNIGRKKKRRTLVRLRQACFTFGAAGIFAELGIRVLFQRSHTYQNHVESATASRIRLIKSIREIITLVLCWSVWLFADEWKLKKSLDGIHIYNSEAPGKSIPKFKAVLKDSVRIESVISVLENVEQYTQWLGHLTESRIVKRVNDTLFYVYQYFDCAWPLSNRDIVVKIIIAKNYAKHHITVSLTSLKGDSLVPEKDGVVRIPEMYGTIRLEILGPEITRGVFEEYIDFGGYVPDWFGKIISEKIPYVVLKSVREQSKTNKYIEAGKNHPDLSKILQLFKSDSISASTR